MASKNNPGIYDCYTHAEPDEPMFVLLGRDATAAVAVRHWIAVREALGDTSPEKLAEAFKCAEDMENWAKAKGKDTKAAFAAHRKVMKRHGGL